MRQFAFELNSVLKTIPGQSGQRLGPSIAAAPQASPGSAAGIKAEMNGMNRRVAKLSGLSWQDLAQVSPGSTAMMLAGCFGNVTGE
jgi:hypothetical protein